MKGRVFLFLSFLLGVLLITACTSGTTQPESTPQMHKEGSTATILAGKSALVRDFTQAEYEAALKTDQVIVLYFYANWCSVCKAEFPQMQEAFSELTTDKVIGFRIHFNSDKYSVLDF